MTNNSWPPTSLHNPVVRSCVEVVGIPRSELRDDIRCPACDSVHRLMHLDPDVREILTREPWCESCLAGDKPAVRSSADSGTGGDHG